MFARSPLLSRLSFVVLLLSSSAFAGPLYVNPANGHSYTLTSTVLDWQAAQDEALSVGGYLASITDSPEQQFITDTFLVGDDKNKAFWIGLSDAASEGVWTWVSGEPFAYANWYNFPPNSEPNNGGPCGGACPENYAAINWHYAFYGYGPDYFFTGYPGEAALGTWNDTPINGTPVPFLYRGIIEIPTVIPVPAAAWLFASALGGLAWLRRR